MWVPSRGLGLGLGLHVFPGVHPGCPSWGPGLGAILGALPGAGPEREGWPPPTRSGRPLRPRLVSPQWEAFSLPELQNFLRILDKEEAEQLQSVRRRYAAYRHKLEEALGEVWKPD